MTARHLLDSPVRVVLLSLMSLLVLPGTAMAVDVLANIPDLHCTGQSSLEGFEGQIIVRSLSDNTARAFDPRTGRLTRTAATADPLFLIKDVDACSPALFKALVLGTALDVTINFLSGTGDRPPQDQVFFRIELKEAHVQSLANTFDGVALPLDRVGFVFRAIRLTDFPRGPDGTPGPPVTVECDFARDVCQ